MVLDMLGIGENQSRRGLRRKTRTAKIWVVHQHLTQRLLGLDAFRSDQNEAEGTRKRPLPRGKL